ncbi:DUF58 domain-containing protein [Methylophaga sp. OBS3]|uniref:DUF58 domain-containing protein n=1 Tax=Methylophaga sp. OBS3 TaxID=2991934 RepID=UPI00225BF6C1|nr:DUF58 domain-containing protein [Methylophaga sp. OBS3]MCX4190160.1 DUF58 domain-containing protein [Methylophaga sp. OBS3]
MFAAIQQQWQRLNAKRGRRVYIIPSRAGYGFALLILIMLLGAINYNNSLAYLLSFLLASIGHVVMHHSYRNARYIQCLPAQPQSIFAGQNLSLALTIENPRNHALSAIEVSYFAGKDHHRWNPLSQFKKYQPVGFVEHIDGQQQQLLTIQLPTEKRGWLDLGRLRFSSVFPLGLFYCWFYNDLHRRVLLYPAPSGDMPLPESGSPKGAKQSSAHPTGRDDFSGFQRYRDGDTRHQIAWKALARDDVMRTKQFSYPKGNELFLDWQLLGNIQGVEAKLSQLCQWVLQADATGRHYSLRLPNQLIVSGQGNQHRHQCLTALALYEQQ